ncbi:hypothetical protein COX97_03505 [Candidatus Pacearchaeota archaeon CG_4_10_14_0_2_um_filter_05_32_18]|nr:MAG: hypothetical protein COX97_03505 [Candidatus Pacearchaeota archaeon CG_4_10_14_0_2_um_filter_05_32_18]
MKKSAIITIILIVVILIISIFLFSNLLQKENPRDKYKNDPNTILAPWESPDIYQNIRWIPDKNSISYVGAEDYDNIERLGFNPSVNSNLVLFEKDVNSKQKTKILDLGKEYVDDYRYDWSPEGSKIVYAIKEDDKDKLKIYDITNKQEKELIVLNERQRFADIMWSTNGDKILFSLTNLAGSEEGDKNGFYLIDSDGTNKKWLFNFVLPDDYATPDRGERIRVYWFNEPNYLYVYSSHGITFVFDLISMNKIDKPNLDNTKCGNSIEFNRLELDSKGRLISLDGEYYLLSNRVNIPSLDTNFYEYITVHKNQEKLCEI